eukprot:8741685-Pyramimonas_sp.AAC.1
MPGSPPRPAAPGPPPGGPVADPVGDPSPRPGACGSALGGLSLCRACPPTGGFSTKNEKYPKNVPK